jgi:hypothetical protein
MGLSTSVATVEATRSLCLIAAELKPLFLRMQESMRASLLDSRIRGNDDVTVQSPPVLPSSQPSPRGRGGLNSYTTTEH